MRTRLCRVVSQWGSWCIVKPASSTLQSRARISVGVGDTTARSRGVYVPSHSTTLCRVATKDWCAEVDTTTLVLRRPYLHSIYPELEYPQC